MSRDINKYEEEYLNSDFECKMVEIRRKKVLEILNDFKPKRILEIGCGVEPIFKFYDTYSLYTVVEPSDHFFKTALREREGFKNRDISIYHDFIENLIDELRSKTFDFILLSGLLHEVKDPKKFISDIIKLMNPGAILHVNVPNANSFHRVLAKESGLIKSEHELSDNNIRLQQNAVFDLEMLKILINEIGGEVVQEGSYFIKPFTHKQMQRLLVENIIDKRVINGFYEMTRHLPNMGAEIFVNVRLAT